MNNDFEELQNKWKSSKNSIDTPTGRFDILDKRIKKKEKENYFFYYGTITILLITLIGISSFFYYVAPVKEILSRIGAGLMIIGLIFRITIEIVSIYKEKQIKSHDKALETTENIIKFHKFRKTIHSVVAPIVIGLYTIGFYMITPEFSLYISFRYMVLIDVSYVVIGIILFIVIRKSVREEMKKLSEIVKLRDDIVE